MIRSYFHMSIRERIDYWEEYLEGFRDYLSNAEVVSSMEPKILWQFDKEVERVELVVSMLNKELGEVVDGKEMRSALTINYNTQEL